MNGNVAAALFNLALFGVWMSLGWWVPAIVAIVCIAVSLTLAVVQS